MRVLIFDGQGSSTSSSTVQHPHTPLATLFLHQTRVAFTARIAALSLATRDALDSRATRIMLSNIRDGSLVLPVSDSTLLRHPLIALPNLYVTQVLRIIEEFETNGFVNESSPIELIGYSSGILSALLVATSFPSPVTTSQAHCASTQLTILSNALALFNVALSIGVEAQCSKEILLRASGLTLDDPDREREWSAVVFGDRRDVLEAKLASWNSRKEDTLFRLHVTAQTTKSCHTVSGLPFTLREFLNSRYPPSTPLSSPLAAASHISLSSTSSASSNASSTSEPNSLSRKSSVSSLCSSVISSCPSPNGLRMFDDVLPPPSSTRSYPSLSLSSSFKYLDIYALFHADIPILHDSRERVIASVFPDLQINESASSSQEEPNTPTYYTFQHNKPSFGDTDKIEKNTRDTLSDLRLAEGYVLCDMRTGYIVPSVLTGKALLECVIDSILLNRIEFARATERLASKADCEVEIVNFGPGTGLARAAVRSLKELFSGPVSLIDLSIHTNAMTDMEKNTAGDSHEPIAVIGMAVNLPAAHDANELWRLLEQGINTVEEIPETRFSISPYTEANPNANKGRQMRTRFGNFLPDNLHASFDNAFFRISPREARSLDPQMRVLMRVGLQAVESAGLVVLDSGESREENGTGALRSDEVGCFVGAATNDYVHNLHPEIGVHYATGTLPAFLAGRLAYALHLSGPSVVLDTACSSSLVAIHQACRALLAGDCKAALAGGVNIISSPDMYIGLDRAHFLSPTGNCKPWDASADGYCRSEGSGMFVLKRLSDALASADNILGVIRATEVNQSAAAVSITRPHGPTQEMLFHSLLNRSGVQPEEVSLVEAHGTGTQAGDPEELKSLRAVLSPNGGSRRGPTNTLTVTSVKGNIGHAEAASGAASLAKVLLMLRNRSVPSQVGLVTLNPKIDCLNKDFTRINTSGRCIEWAPSSSGRRIALVNNFGAAGSNAAMLVEEAPIRTRISSSALKKGSADHVIVGLSAETQDALLRLRDSYIASVTDSSIVDFGYTATARRKLRPWRIAVSADTTSSLVKALSDACPVRISSVPNQGGKIAFVFSGQGGQHIGMGRQLYKTSQSFRAVVDFCHEKLLEWGFPGVLPIIDAETISELEKDNEIVAFQCAVFVLQCALCTQWENWGLKPDAVMGHILGEYAALVAARVISLDTGLRLVAHRARLMTQYCQFDASGMLVVRLPARVVSEILSNFDGCDTLSIACYNGPNDVVVGGSIGQLTTLKAHLEVSGFKCVYVDVPFAYHTSAMEPVLEELATFAQKFHYAAPSVPVVSNVAGRVVHAGDSSVFNSEYFAQHCRQAVQFEEGARDLVNILGDVSAFVEIGPHPTTLPMLAQLTSASGTAAVYSLHKKTTARTALCSALARLFVLRNGIAWDKAYHDLFPAASCMEIPGYPLAEVEFWVPFVEGATNTCTAVQPLDPLKRFSFLDVWTQMPSTKDGNISEFETSLERLAEYITGHNVASSPLCPASVYFELALSAATCTLEHEHEHLAESLTLSDVQFTLPLVYDPTRPVLVRTTINLHPKGAKHAGTFSISSVVDGMEQGVHCTGFFQRRQKALMSSKLQLHAGGFERGKANLLDGENGVYRETLRSRTIYELIFSRVVQYSKLYQVIETLTLDERNGEGFATFRLSPKQANGGFVAQPVFVDALLHAAGFLINSRAAGSDAYICNQVDASKMLSNLDLSANFEVYCTTVPAGDGLMLADAWAVENGKSRRIVAHMKRMRFSRVRLSSLSRHLSRLEDIPSRTSSPAPFLRHALERCVSPAMPAKLGSPFRPMSRAATPSAMSVSTSPHNSLGIYSEIIRLISDICAIPASEINLDSNIVDLGIDSLIWIELVGQLKSVVPSLAVNTAELMLSTSVGDLVSKVEEAHRLPTFVVDSSELQTPFTKTTSRTAGPPDLTEVSPSDIRSSLSPVKEILAKVLDVNPYSLRDEDALDALGLDSLGSIEALAELQEHFHVSLPHDFFVECPDLGSVQRAIADIMSEDSRSRQSTSSTLVDSEPLQKVLGPDHMLLPLQSSQTSSKPVFLVHDGSGLSHCYSQIGGLDRSLWGVSNPKLMDGGSWTGGIPEMAEHYIDQIKPIISDKGCILGGWSFGGVVAFHMACKLMRSGLKVAGVVLIDSPSPFTDKPLPEALIDSVVTAPSSSHFSKQQAQIVQLARKQMTQATQALVTYDPSNLAAADDAPEYPNIVMLRCTDAFSLDKIRETTPLDRMPFLEERGDRKAFVRDWERLIGKNVPVLDIPGHHFQPFAPTNVSIFTQRLKEAIFHLEAAL